MKQIKYRSGYKYQLAEPHKCKVKVYPQEGIITEYIELDVNGNLVIKQGYAWDGASGPTFDSKSSMRASLVHDALYQLIRHGFLRVTDRMAIDLEFRKICIEDGMWAWRAELWYRMVRKYADFACSPDNKKKTHIAP